MYIYIYIHVYIIYIYITHCIYIFNLQIYIYVYVHVCVRITMTAMPLNLADSEKDTLFLYQKGTFFLHHTLPYTFSHMFTNDFCANMYTLQCVQIYRVYTSNVCELYIYIYTYILYLLTKHLYLITIIHYSMYSK